MGNFFISAFEKLVGVVVVLLLLAVVGGAVLATMQPGGGILAALGVLVVGTLYVILIAGSLYLALGIYNNTKRTAEAVERLASK
ncbi:hypothetical protein [Phaeobacter inhibens]|uniref:hypothetical protein n=1 Tax=Phaeobacter inhibens TaxID=221822 RepID=UPI000C9AF56B|nr:hypothetical protein [Phaeobacter inhibens]AUQ52972.1 hypothetical protein PhaeoP92_00263 [Phaeobacter inhibens]AUQ76989.1 hypothetical protein PhaeoP74_00265 [Phaeobacter inhibens]AUR14148.1 hypothetical protein PhaeoP70_00263 [Phaeobacter inhibens]